MPGLPSATRARRFGIAYAVFFVPYILAASVLPRIPIIGGLLSLVFMIGAWLAYGFMVKGMLFETQTASGNQDFKWWFQLVPGLHLYFDVLKVPEMITQAKTQAGIIQQKPVQSIPLYLFAFPFALASDLNDLAPPGPPA